VDSIKSRRGVRSIAGLCILGFEVAWYSATLDDMVEFDGKRGGAEKYPLDRGSRKTEREVGHRPDARVPGRRQGSRKREVEVTDEKRPAINRMRVIKTADEIEKLPAT
jgi:hypothetical protein